MCGARRPRGAFCRSPRGRAPLQGGRPSRLITSLEEPNP
jgi:hypothetical protein